MKHLIIKRLIKRIALLVFCLSIALAGAFYYLFYTTSGSSLITKTLMSHYLGPANVMVKCIGGTFAKGIFIQGIKLSSFKNILQGSSVGIEEVNIGSLLALSGGPLSLEMRNIRIGPTSMAGEITASKIEVQLFGDLILHDVLFNEIHGFPNGSTLSIEKLEADFPIRLENVKSVHNGLLRLPNSDPVFFYGQKQNEQIKAHLYAHTLDSDHLLWVIPKNPKLVGLKGLLADVNISIDGSLDVGNLAGTLMISRFSKKGFIVSRCPVKLELNFKGPPSAPSLFGEVRVLGGSLSARGVPVTLYPGKIIFSGDPKTPLLDLKGVADVEGETISVSLKGALAKPDLILTSDPPKPQRLLFFMLATGKSFKGAQDTFVPGSVPVDLAADFIDYFVFGGLGSKIAKYFGMTGVSMRVDDQAETVGIQTTFADKLSVGIETDPKAFTKQPEAAADPSLPPDNPPIPVKVEAEYKVSDTTAVQLELERTASPKLNPPTSTDQQNTAPLTDDTVILKVKKQF